MNLGASAFYVWLVCCGVGLGVSISRAEQAQDFDHPNSYLGNAGWNAALELWMEIGELPVGPGVSLPVRLRLASAPSRPEALFGSLFWCPVLESTLSRPKAHYLEFTTLGGGLRFLSRAPDGDFVSLNGRSSAHLDENTVEVRSQGWRYRYSGGKIREAVSPDGASVVWTYQDGRIAGLTGSDGETLLSVTRTEDGVTLNGKLGKFQFRGEGPDAAGVSRWRLSFQGGREETMALTPEGADVIRLDRVFPGGAARVYRWQAGSGALLSDGDFTYEMRPADTGLSLLHRIDREGRTEWYTFDTVKGRSVYKRQDGSRVVSWYHVQPGPTYMKAFRMDSLTEDQRLVSSRRLAYDAGGNIRKAWTEPGEALPENPDGLRYIGLEEAERLHRQRDVLFVDARASVEYSRGHIPGAVRLGRDPFETDLASLERELKAAVTLVVYCASRQCEDSGIVAAQLWQRGFRRILVFEGGWEEWGEGNR